MGPVTFSLEVISSITTMEAMVEEEVEAEEPEEDGEVEAQPDLLRRVPSMEDVSCVEAKDIAGIIAVERKLQELRVLSVVEADTSVTPAQASKGR